MPYRERPDDQPAQWACSDCGHRSSASGVCARCGEGPLLDLEDPNVVEALLARDQRRTEAKRRWNIAVAVPFGLLAAGMTMFWPCHYRMCELPVIAAPLAGLVASALALVVLARLSRGRQLWASLRPSPAEPSREDVESFKKIRSSVVSEIGGGVLLVMAVLFVATLIVGAVETIAHRQNEARGKQLDVIRERWTGLRRCLLARSEPNDATRAALRMWHEAQEPPRANCDPEASALYVEARKYPGDELQIVPALEKIAQCKGRCEMPALDHDRAFTLRRASYEFSGNWSYVWTEPR